jgi:hypothetical protein
VESKLRKETFLKEYLFIIKKMAELSTIITDDEDDYLYSSFMAQSRQNAAASCLQ